MAKQYAWQKSLVRIYRKLKGDTISAVAEELIESPSSANEALAGIAEILQGSGTDDLHLGIPIWFHPITSAPTGTALSYLGGNMYAQDGALKWIGSSGTISTLAGS